MIGYPGIDKKWVKYICAKKERKEQIKCIIATRKFSLNKEKDMFTLTYEEAFKYLSEIRKVFDGVGTAVTAVIKPHPSANIKETEVMVKKAGFKDYTISTEPIYKVFQDADLMIGTFTTILVMAPFYNVPVILVDSELQQYVHKNWDKLEDLYSGFKFFSSDYRELSSAIRKNIMDIKIKDKENSNAEHDVQHIRQFYHDNAIERAIERLEKVSCN